MKKILVSIVILACAAITSAAQPSKIVTPKESNYWFIDTGVGVNGMYDAKKIGGWGIGADVAVGKWFLPEFAVRLGVYGVTGSGIKGQPSWFSEDKAYGKCSVALDILWDVINTANEDYYWNAYHIQPFLRFQETFGFSEGKKAATFNFGAGLRQTIKINRTLSAVIDLSGVLSGEGPWNGGGGFIVFGTATAGLSVRL